GDLGDAVGGAQLVDRDVGVVDRGGALGELGGQPAEVAVHGLAPVGDPGELGPESLALGRLAGHPLSGVRGDAVKPLVKASDIAGDALARGIEVGPQALDVGAKRLLGLRARVAPYLQPLLRRRDAALGVLDLLGDARPLRRGHAAMLTVAPDATVARFPLFALDDDDR